MTTITGRNADAARVNDGDVDVNVVVVVIEGDGQRKRQFVAIGRFSSFIY